MDLAITVGTFLGGVLKAVGKTLWILIKLLVAFVKTRSKVNAVQAQNTQVRLLAFMPLKLHIAALFFVIINPVIFYIIKVFFADSKNVFVSVLPYIFLGIPVLVTSVFWLCGYIQELVAYALYRLGESKVDLSKRVSDGHYLQGDFWDMVDTVQAVQKADIRQDERIRKEAGEKEETVRQMLLSGASSSAITGRTGLTAYEIQQIKAKNGII